MHRSSSFDKLLSERLQNPKLAQLYFLEVISGEESLSVEDALKHVIQAMGIKEYSSISGVAAPNVVKFLRGKRRLKPETLDQYLKPFRLKSKIIVEKAS